MTESLQIPIKPSLYLEAVTNIWHFTVLITDKILHLQGVNASLNHYIYIVCLFVCLFELFELGDLSALHEFP